MNNLQKLKFLNLLNSLSHAPKTQKMSIGNDKNKFKIPVIASSDSMPPEHIEQIHKSINKFSLLPRTLQKILVNSLAEGAHQNRISVHGPDTPKPISYLPVVHDLPNKHIHIWADPVNPYNPQELNGHIHGALLRNAAHNLITDATTGQETLRRSVPEQDPTRPLENDFKRKQAARQIQIKIQKLQQIHGALKQFQDSLYAEDSKHHGRVVKQLQKHKKTHEANQFIPTLTNELARKFKQMAHNPSAYMLKNTKMDAAFGNLWKILQKSY